MTCHLCIWFEWNESEVQPGKLFISTTWSNAMLSILFLISSYCWYNVSSFLQLLSLWTTFPSGLLRHFLCTCFNLHVFCRFTVLHSSHSLCMINRKSNSLAFILWFRCYLILIVDENWWIGVLHCSFSVMSLIKQRSSRVQSCYGICSSFEWIFWHVSCLAYLNCHWETFLGQAFWAKLFLYVDSLSLHVDHM